MEVVAHVPLAPFTTMGVGGPARFFFEARDETTAREACVWAREHRVPIRILGGGSNLVIDDAGVDALVMRMALRGVSTRETDGAVEITAAAGEPWDAVVADAVALLRDRFADVRNDGPTAYAAFLDLAGDREAAARLRNEAVEAVRLALEAFDGARGLT